MSERLTLYKSGEEPRQVWSIDSQDYINGGWSLEPIVEVETPEPPPVRHRKNAAVISEAE